MPQLDFHRCIQFPVTIFAEVLVQKYNKMVSIIDRLVKIITNKDDLSRSA